MTTAADRPASEPRYYTVKRHLLEFIGSLEPGAAVPTERELALEMQTSRTTVRQALGELVVEGRLVRRQGSGTYVAEPKITWPLYVASFTEQVYASGFTPSAQVLGTQRIAASAELSQRLRLSARAPVYKIERLRLADNWPAAVRRTVPRPVRAANVDTDVGSAVGCKASDTTSRQSASPAALTLMPARSSPPFRTADVAPTEPPVRVPPRRSPAPPSSAVVCSDPGVRRLAGVRTDLAQTAHHGAP